MTNPERTTTTRCCLPHRRIREKGEVFTHPDGTEAAADGTEVVWDHDAVRDGAHNGSLLCVGHFKAAKSALADLPDIAVQCRVEMLPGAGNNDRVSGTRTPPLPFHAGALDDADDILAWIWPWVRMVSEESGHSMPTIRAWLTLKGVERGITRGDLSPIKDAVAWLLARLEWISEQAWIDELFTEAREKRNEMLARHPYEERAVYLPAPCPGCDLLTLVRRAPKWAGAPVTIICDSDQCGMGMPEQLYPAWTERILEEKQASA